MIVIHAQILYSKFAVLLNCVTFTRLIYIPNASIERNRKNNVELRNGNAIL